MYRFFLILDTVLLSELDGGFQLGEEGGGEKELERTHNHREFWGYRENQKIHENPEKWIIREIR